MPILFFGLSCNQHDDKINNDRDVSVGEEVSSHEPDLIASWRTTPWVKICPDSPARIERVRSALKFWKNLGYMIGSISFDHGTICFTNSTPFGAITVEMNGSSMKEQHSGQTALYYDPNTREAIGARVYIRNTTATWDRVLEHEFGHSLGWGHLNRRSHIMNPAHDRGGFDNFGLARLRQLQRLPDRDIALTDQNIKIATFIHEN